MSPMQDLETSFGRLAGLTRPFAAFAHQQWSGGVMLMICAVIALAAANSPWAAGWAHFWHIPITVGAPGLRIEHTLAHWINDGLMVLFFLLVGLEIKREMVCGELSTVRKALLPIAAAVGGMAAPALIFTWFNHGGSGSSGWGIPTATDIAFALGVMRLVAGRIPAALFVFLTALAIADDLGAVIVIALFYTASIQWDAILGAAVVLAVLTTLNRLKVTHGLPYAVGGIVLWALVLASGVHATVAGVLLALTIPIRSDADHASTLHRWEHALHPWTTFVILPVFALANAGVALSGNLAAALHDALFWGVALGLVVGKPLGITLLAWLTVRSGLASLPAGVSWAQVAAVSALGGIGFTMSLFIGSLAFTDERLIDVAKLGIIFGSLAAALIGAAACALAPGPRTEPSR